MPRRGRLVASAEPAEPFPAAWPPPGAEPVPVATLYHRLSDLGYDYGPLFQGVRAAWQDADHTWTEVALDDDQDGYAVHPRCSTHCCTVACSAGPRAPGRASVHLFRVSLGRGGGSPVRVRMGPAGGSAVRVDAVDGSGEPVVSIAALTSRPADRARLEAALGVAAGGDPLYEVRWLPAGPVGTSPPTRRCCAYRPARTFTPRWARCSRRCSAPSRTTGR
ncbi:polyketide synthase dehydratase domain-containing protein [Micromonospora sp. M12]